MLNKSQRSWFHSSLNVTIHLLPVYYPSEKEISNPQIYCENVQGKFSLKSKRKKIMNFIFSFNK